MSAATSLRRLFVGIVIFGSVMSVVVWRAGDLVDSGETATERDPGQSARAPDGSVVRVSTEASLGSGRGVRVSRQGVAVVDGEPITFRLWEGSWDRQQPVPGKTIDEHRLLTEGFSVLLFHQRPTVEEPRPRAIEGPETTRVDADEAELELAADSTFNAALSGNVRMVSHATDGDLVVLTERLDLERKDSSGTDEEVRATSDARVTVDGEGTHLAGTGLDADVTRGRDSGAIRQTRVTLHKDVRGEFLAPLGALTGQGSDETSPAVPTTITCSSTATLQSLRPGTSRQPSRWLATFQDDVVVSQSPTTLRCSTLEVEFEMPPKGRKGGRIEVLRVVADGGVLVEGRHEATAAAWSLRSGKSITHRDAKGGYDVDLLGGTKLVFDGTLRGRRKKGEQGRVEIQCSGPAQLHSDATAARPGGPVRGRIAFHENVIARQWGADGDLETEVRAPEVTLLGNRVQVGDARLDPETLVATGNDTERVHVKRETLSATTRLLTWRVLRKLDLERLYLNGRPVARFEHPREQSSTLLLEAEDSIELAWRHTPPVEEAERRSYATAKASKNVVMSRIVGERETYRLSANTLEATFDADLQPRKFRAYDNVKLTGRGESPGARRVDLRGDRMAAEIAAPTDGKDEWSRTTIEMFGQKGRPATAVINEAEVARDGPQEHQVAAGHLSYEAGGALVVARRHARVFLERIARDPETDERIDATISGALLRVHLRPASGVADGRPEILRVEGEGGVAIESPSAVVTGDVVTYDLVSGLAVATGRPARLIFRHTAGHGGERWSGKVGELDSFVTSEEIRAEFDTTTRGTGRPRRATCAGGRLRFFQYESKDGEQIAPTRVTLMTTGPIEVLPGSASASGDVELAWETKQPNGRLMRIARLLADRAEITLDDAAEGALRDRITRAVATGTRSRPARFFSPDLDAVADRVESDGAWIEMLSPWGRRVRVTQRDPPDSLSCRKARFNYLTEEFEATGADYSQPIEQPVKEKR